MLTRDGELKTLSREQTAALIHKKPLLVCHAPFCRAKLGNDVQFIAFDVLELFAFVHPATFSTPTVNGLCKTLGLAEPASLDDAPMSLLEITRALLGDLRADPHKAKADPLEIARVMGLNGSKGRGGWAWTPFVFSALGEPYDEAVPVNSKTGLNIWKNLPEWAEEAPPPPASHHGVSEDEACERLQKLRGFDDAEQRQSQIEYAEKITHAFAPIRSHPVGAPEGRSHKRDPEKSSIKDAAHMDPRCLSSASQNRGDGANIKPNIVLAEAGTGVGKTLGYLAPASVWAEKNQGTVWISTYTKNLQRQIDQELDRLYPNPELKAVHVATRKGRENYLCLLNLEETAAGAALAKHPDAAIAAGIMARWAAASKDGDLTGADYPGWLAGLLGYRHTSALADRRGECVYSACDHYHKCFVEHSQRKAQHARIVVANHALVMISSALSTPGDGLPGRYIFDEGHHLFEAADSAFAAHLTACEARDLRRWILGNEGGRRASRARGLKRRAEDLTEGMQAAEELLRKILNAAEALPMDGWTRRLRDSMPSGPTEHFTAQIYRTVSARADGRDGPYSLETELFPVDEDLLTAARKLKSALADLQKPMQALARLFMKKLTEDDGMLSADTRKRLEALSAALERRAALTLQAWIAMLENLDKGPDGSNTSSDFIDWMEIERIDGQAVDVGLYRHHIDPMKPFAASIAPHLHGMAVTSATLRDSSQDDHADWQSALQRTGAGLLNPDTETCSFASPFDYATQTKIFVVNDVNKHNLDQVAGAYRALFKAAGGGALGLFTAISRLRAVQARIAGELENAGLPLYAQHVDEIDTGTLVDMFREDEHACLLGTDAIRDGVDVPGNALRLIVFDRVPWPRPTILHKARRDAFGRRAYDEMITRLKLKQAYGRLIRRATDRGVFVMLDSGLPTRLQSAFPKNVEVVKTGLTNVVEEMKTFL
ncbi:MAG: ATP-dependent DNA helicase [Rhodospirillales bacterium]|nr:ATP-dependent DNA helicase [Rhodospirillales bacterium]